MNSRIYRNHKVGISVVGAFPSPIHPKANGTLHTREGEWKRLIFVFNKDDLRLASRWRRWRWLVLLCGDIEFNAVIAAGIRQDRLGARLHR